MKKLFSMMMLMMMVCGTVFAMGLKPNDSRATLNCINAKQASCVQGTTEEAMNVYNACNTKAFCDCYTQYKNPLAARYCA